MLVARSSAGSRSYADALNAGRTASLVSPTSPTFAAAQIALPPSPLLVSDDSSSLVTTNNAMIISMALESMLNIQKDICFGSLEPISFPIVEKMLLPPAPVLAVPRPTWTPAPAPAPARTPVNPDFLPAKSVNPLTGLPYRRQPSTSSAPPNILTKPPPASVSETLVHAEEIEKKLLAQKDRLLRRERIKQEVIDSLRRVPIQGPPPPIRINEPTRGRSVGRTIKIAAPKSKKSKKAKDGVHVSRHRSPPPSSSTQTIHVPPPPPTTCLDIAPPRRRPANKLHLIGSGGSKPYPPLPRQPLVYEHPSFLLAIATHNARCDRSESDSVLLEGGPVGYDVLGGMSKIRRPWPAFSVRGCHERGDMSERMAGRSPLRSGWVAGEVFDELD